MVSRGFGIWFKKHTGWVVLRGMTDWRTILHAKMNGKYRMKVDRTWPRFREKRIALDFATAFAH